MVYAYRGLKDTVKLARQAKLIKSNMVVINGSSDIGNILIEIMKLHGFKVDHIYGLIFSRTKNHKVVYLNTFVQEDNEHEIAIHARAGDSNAKKDGAAFSYGSLGNLGSLTLNLADPKTNLEAKIADFIKSLARRNSTKWRG